MNFLDKEKVVSLLKEALSDLILKRANAGDIEELEDLMVLLMTMLLVNDEALGSLIRRKVLIDPAEAIKESLDKRNLTNLSWADKSKHPLLVAAFKEAATKFTDAQTPY